MAVTKGGRKRDWKDNRKGQNAVYKQRLREVARQGKGFNASGNEETGTAVAGAMHDHLIRGYNLKG